MILRFATVEDADRIATLHAESWRVAYRGIFRDEYLDRDVFQDRKDVWLSRLSFPAENQCVILAEEDDELCGFICAFGNDDPGWGTLIDNLHIRQDRKGLGIGKALMKEIALWVQKNYSGMGLYLGVLEPNIAARRFYEKLGAIYMESSIWEPPGGGKVVNLCYVWADVDSLLSC